MFYLYIMGIEENLITVCIVSAYFKLGLSSNLFVWGSSQVSSLCDFAQFWIVWRYMLPFEWLFFLCLLFLLLLWLWTPKQLIPSVSYVNRSQTLSLHSSKLSIFTVSLMLAFIAKWGTLAQLSSFGILFMIVVF